MKGNISSGTFAGNWDEIKVNHGSISMNQNFSKYPKYALRRCQSPTFVIYI